MRSKKESMNKKRRNEKELRAIALFGIYLIISLTVVSAYAIRESNGIQTDLKGSVSTVLIGFLNFMLPSVSAATGCCMITNSGEYCKEGVQQSDCSTGYYGGKCSDVPNGECNLGTCIQQNGDCDAQTFKKKCGDSFGFWNPATLLEINSCTPSCCIFTQNNIVVDAQWVFFKNKCEKNQLVKDGELDVITQDITYKACRESIPPKTTGYCTLTAKSECKFMAKSECDAQKGDFSSQKCASCISNYTKEAYNGNQGYGVYNFDSCKGPENIVESCGIEEIVENVNGVPRCVLKTCTLNLPFTNLNYDMAFFKKGQVAINGQLRNTPSSLSIDQGQQVCVNFQGPGEQHYKATCQLGELMVFGVDDERKTICTYNAQTGITQDTANKYLECSTCGDDKWTGKNLGSVLSKVFSFLGADFINPKWWDYWVQNPGLCSQSRCEGLGGGNCVFTDNNDCVPKYAPANQDICNECSTTEASSPWNKCGEEVQCTSRGYCQLSSNKMNPLAGATICTIQTLTQQALITAVQKTADGLGVTKAAQDARNAAIAKEKDKFEGFGKSYAAQWNNKVTVMNFIPGLLKAIFFTPSILLKAATSGSSSLTDSERRTVTNDYLDANPAIREQFNSEQGYNGNMDQYLADLKTNQVLDKPGLNWAAGFDFLVTFLGGTSAKSTMAEKLSSLNAEALALAKQKAALEEKQRLAKIANDAAAAKKAADDLAALQIKTDQVAKAQADAQNKITAEAAKIADAEKSLTTTDTTPATAPTATGNQIAPVLILSGTETLAAFDNYNFAADSGAMDANGNYVAQLRDGSIIMWNGRQTYFVDNKPATDSQRIGISTYFEASIRNDPTRFEKPVVTLPPVTTTPKVPAGAESVTTGQAIRGFTGDAVAPSPTLGQQSSQTTVGKCSFTVIASTLPKENASNVLELNKLNDINSFSSRVVATKVYRNCVCNVQTKRYEQCIDESRRYVEATTFTDLTGVQNEINRLNNLNVNCRNSNAQSKILDPTKLNTDPKNLICLNNAPDIMVFSQTWKKTEVYHPGEKVTEDFMAKYCTADTSKLNVCDRARLASLVAAPTETSAPSTESNTPAPVLIDEATQNENPETALPVKDVGLKFGKAYHWFFQKDAAIVQVDYLGETEMVTVKQDLFGQNYVVKVRSTYPGTSKQINWNLGIDADPEKGIDEYSAFERATTIQRGNEILNDASPTGYSYMELYDQLSMSNDPRAKSIIANLPDPYWLMKLIPALEKYNKQ